MDNRYGHHHHHHRSDDAGDQPPPPTFYPPPPRPDLPPYYDHPPPPPFGSYNDQPPPPPFQERPPPVYPPPGQFGGAYQSPSYPEHQNYPPPQSSMGYAEHEAHVPAGEEHHRHRPHMPAFVDSHIHGHGHHSEGGSGSNLSGKPSVKVYCKADTNHMLAIRNDKVVLARSDPNDPTQHWVKDEKFSTTVKDQEGFPCFALINKATGQAMKHSVGFTHPVELQKVGISQGLSSASLEPGVSSATTSLSFETRVQLIAYNPNALDESILWTTGKDLGSGYRQIRMVNNIQLVVDAFNGDKKHGGVHDGTTIVLWSPGKGDNQRWHISPYCKSVHTQSF